MKKRAKFLLPVLGVMVFFNLASVRADDTCKSVRDQLADEIREKLGAPNAQVMLLSIDTVKSETSGDESGYECIGRANVQKGSSSPPQTVKFIYTVTNGRNFKGYQGIDFTAVGIAYFCGEDKQWDQIYSACSK
ncbi:hypothetical protein [Bradyrhizobium sp. 6(2017)]|uniref:hypothetical protein n=1 Tax=Bradyrhizobium sp. 6(2017) TaxID=1197460 RepID=UPI002FE66BF3